MNTTLGIGDWAASARRRRLAVGAFTGVTLMLAMLTPALAQPNRTNPANPTNSANRSNPTNQTDAAVPPIECWWKTDRSAVHVGETFLLTLTCAVLDTDRVKVVVDESSLEPAALHLTPFEIVGGQRFRDIPNAPRRFFQYQYSVRALGEEFFGREVTLPRLQISYRVQNSLQGGAALQGREAQYSLVPVPIRVLSLVPPGTSDIRDTPAETFGDVDARLFRSNLLLLVSGVAFLVAVLILVMFVARAAVKRRATAAVRQRVVSPTSVLTAASRELGDVRGAAQAGGWNSELAGRAAAALRLAGAVALGEPVGQKELERTTVASEGQVAGRAGLGLPGGRKVAFSASVTPDTNARNGTAPSPEIWQTIRQPLRDFTAARYSRNGTIDGVALDSALADAQDAVKRLRVAQLTRFGRRRRAAETASARHTWAR